jgi:ATP-binding cassette subfamily C (CFTR/MRP) protein 4
MSNSGAGTTAPAATGIPNALKNAGFVSQLFFTWALPILQQGDDLRADQVFELLPQDSTTLLYFKLARAWDATLAAGKPSLVRAFWGAFGWNFLVTIPWLAVKCCFIVAQTQFLGLLLTTLGAGAQADGTAAYLYGLGFILCALFNAFLHHSFFFAAWRSGMRWRAAASALVFHKSLKLRLDALSRVSAGHVINLASNDVERLQKLSQYSPYLVVVPMETGALFVLLGALCGCLRRTPPTRLRQ